jgi:ribosome biogenesis GTPase A
VGKSSLLNALFGKSKVRASKTPGKVDICVPPLFKSKPNPMINQTKHFQTLFWTSEVRLVDCPGLVLPSFVHMETQVLSGILPISRISAIPLCIYHASQLLPLERILGLQHPSLSTPAPEDKRTWREPREAAAGGKIADPVWTAMDILTAYATKVGWMTAKAGRPDTNRAGNASASISLSSFT